MHVPTYACENIQFINFDMLFDFIFSSNCSEKLLRTNCTSNASGKLLIFLIFLVKKVAKDN